MIFASAGIKRRLSSSSRVKGKHAPKTTTNTIVTMEAIVSLCKQRGFVFPSAEIYNSLAGFFDYGPQGKGVFIFLLQSKGSQKH